MKTIILTGVLLASGCSTPPKHYVSDYTITRQPRKKDNTLLSSAFAFLLGSLYVTAELAR